MTKPNCCNTSYNGSLYCCESKAYHVIPVVIASFFRHNRYLQTMIDGYYPLHGLKLGKVAKSMGNVSIIFSPDLSCTSVQSKFGLKYHLIISICHFKQLCQLGCGNIVQFSFSLSISNFAGNCLESQVLFKCFHSVS